MMHPSTKLAFINEEKGHGVVATEFIPKGTITWVHDKLDRIFTQREFDAMEPLFQNVLDTYTYRNKNSDFVFCWDHSKYVNHSFNSNCLSTAYDFEIAIRDIFEGEELTDDYGYLNIVEPFVLEDSESDRKVVHPDDTKRMYPMWDQILKEVFPRINQVDQPLFHIIKDETQEELKQVLQGEKEIRSTLELLASVLK